MPDLLTHSSQQKKAIAGDNESSGNENLVNYATESRRLDETIKQFDKTMEEIDRKNFCEEVLADEKFDEIKEFEEKAKAAAIALNKEIEKYKKIQSKELSELEEQQLKTAKLAQKLAQNQVHTEAELEKAREVIDNEAEARRLAEELVNEREEECRVAEQRMHELIRVEKEMKNTVNELCQRQGEAISEFKHKQKEMDSKIAFARDDLEELKIRYENDKEDLDENEIRLDKIRVHAGMLQDLAEKHEKEHAEWMQYVQELNNKAEQERYAANKVLNDYQKLQNEIVAQKKKLDQEESELKEREYIVSKQKEQRKLIESCGREQLKDQELVCEKAEELARKLQEERRQAQEEVAMLVQEENAAKKVAAELNKKMNVKMEEKPACVDDFQDALYGTTDISEVQIGEREEKSLGTKIMDGVKSLF